MPIIRNNKPEDQETYVETNTYPEAWKPFPISHLNWLYKPSDQVKSRVAN